MTEGSLGDGSLKFRQTLPASDANGWEVGKLPATGGQWTTSEFPIDGKTAKMGQLEFHTGWLELGKMLWIKSVIVTSGDPASVRAAAQASGELSAGNKVLFDSDFGALVPFREKARSIDGSQKSKIAKVIERSGDRQFPPDWQIMSWDPDTVHEVSAGELYGSQALTIRTVAGKPTTMLFAPRVSFPGPRVRVRIEYALPGGSGHCVVRLRHLAPEFGDVWDVAKLDRTENAWQVADFDLEVRAATAGHLEFHTTELPEGEAVSIKSVTVYQPAE